MTIGMRELVIVGAGPAGLAAAHAAAPLDPLVLEAGKPLAMRDQHDQVDLVRGIGGAGLYSDGKFSFWPSATGLWTLDPRFLPIAYDWFTRQAATAGITAPPPPSSPQSTEPLDAAEKLYPSVYASQQARESLIQALAAPVDVLTDITVQALTRDGNAWQVDSQGGTFQARKVILTTGRLGPILLSHPEEARRKPLRLEVGVRIQQPSQHFFLRDHPQLDPKYIWRDPQGSVQWRTFCCCRDGLVAATRLTDYVTVSGRADGPPTGFSNVGFNVRISDPEEIARLWPTLRHSIGGSPEPIHCPLADVLDDSSEADPLRSLFGARLYELLRTGLLTLVAERGRPAFEGATLIAPTLEGVGSYLEHDPQLQTTAASLWVAGDATGTFRGLTASLVSGYAAGLSAAEKEDTSAR